ncbi:cobyric acid synthase [Pontibacillus salicampi]|uniref:Cobyric acid synthase n=1 Tax=Pontibacillus salicampi TaxID=1449801 RepID=A0ABV6LK36_9BACI
MKGVMIQGTSSNVGKSIVVTALCRWLSNHGYKVTPFKSQNMSNNSYVTRAGTEIGRAQGVQAEASRTTAIPEMNPILLKPRNDQRAEVICLGESIHTYSGMEYRDAFYDKGKASILHSLQQLEKQFDYIIIEGAGSPVEVNLNDKELVNMSIAEMADVPVILVADIDRGGVFASIVGTLQLLSEHQRKRVKGIIINKFRGDRQLFEDGVEWIENYTGIKVLGIMPHVDHHIEAEDSLSLREKRTTPHKTKIDLAVVALPYLSNFTDIDPFYLEADVDIRYVYRQEDLGSPDALIIPGTRSTMEDLQQLRSSGLEQAIMNYIQQGGTIAGICGGYQMLSTTLVEEEKVMDGIGILPMTTYFHRKKVTRRVEGNLHPKSGFGTYSIEGFEIHLGDSKWDHWEHGFPPLFQINEKKEGVVVDNGRIIGTHLHHCFHNDTFRTSWLNRIRGENGFPIREYTVRKKDPYDEMAHIFAAHMNMNELWDIINQRENSL